MAKRASSSVRRPASQRIPLAIAVVLCLLGTARLGAQSEELPPPPPGYDPVVSDLVPEAVLDKTRVDSSRFTLRLGFVPIVDYTWFSQDRASVEQVGEQEDTWDIRSGRVLARGKLFADAAHPLRYLVAFEYKGFDSDPAVTWSFTDISITVPVGRLGDLTLGKTKEPFAYEMVGDAANLPHIERLMSPFFVSRNVGLKLDRSLAGERMTLSLGVYNDWWVAGVPYSENATDVAARVTGLAWMDASGRRYLHLAGAYRYAGADDGQMRYKGRPESNVADNYVDTGSFAASHGDHYGVEALWNEGPFSVTAEYDEARVESPTTGDPRFHGWYATTSWVVTGEHRPYDRKVGYARRVLPSGRWGAVELIGRYGVVDLDDGAVHGGELAKWYGGVNWWANRRIRISLGYGRATLDRSGLVGHTDQLFTRLQWVY